MALPKLGTYIASNKTMQIIISNANSSIGQITGTYQNDFTPVNTVIIEGVIGGYAWVSDAEGQSGAAPFCINFTASQRPTNRPYCLVDFWNGYYTVDNTIVITGSRSYVSSEGKMESISLGTLTLTWIEPS